MSNYLRDLTRVVLLSSDALQTDIQRIQLLQKVKHLNLILFEIKPEFYKKEYEQVKYGNDFIIYSLVYCFD